MRMLLETGTESEWVAQALEAAGHEVIVADPNYAPMYGELRRRVKTDRRDVAALAEANRRGWYRAAHRRSAAQRAVQQILRSAAATGGDADRDDLGDPRAAAPRRVSLPSGSSAQVPARVAPLDAARGAWRRRWRRCGGPSRR